MWFVIFSVVFFKCAFRQILFYFPFKYFFCLVFSGVFDAENVREADLKSQLSLILPLFESASPHRCVRVCVWMDSAYAHTFVSFALIFFVFLFVFILIFSPYFSDILQSPCYARVLVILIWFGCPSLVS